MSSDFPWPTPGDGLISEWPILLALRGRSFGTGSEPMPAVDATAWSLVALLLFCLVWIGGTVFLIRRRLRQRPLEKEEKSDVETPAGSGERHQAWQKPDDWWKK